MPRGVPELRLEGFQTIVIHCVGQHAGGGRCWHQARLALSQLPEASWEELCPWMRCTACHNAGYVNLALDWNEVIDFNSPGGTRRVGDWPSS